MDTLNVCLQAGDWDSLAKECETSELNSLSCGQNPSARVYGSLLAVYLLQNDLVNAKFLWKRLSRECQQDPTVSQLWEAGKCLWKKDMCSAHAVLSQNWPPHVQPIVKALVESLRRQAARTVAQCYSKISCHEFGAMLGVADVRSACSELGWAISDDCWVLPTKPVENITSNGGSGGHQPLGVLANYVSMLEN